MILAFDLATVTGAALGDARSEPRWWTLKLGSGRHQGAKFAQLLIDTRRILREHRPSLIVVEKAIAAGVKGGEGRVQIAFGLRAVVLTAAFIEGGVRIEDVPIQAIRSHFIDGSRVPRAEAKQRVMTRCREYGWTPQNDNEGDALALWHYAACRWGGRPSGRRGGLFDDAISTVEDRP